MNGGMHHPRFARGKQFHSAGGPRYPPVTGGKNAISRAPDTLADGFAWA
jgi:hypothetical protein